MKPRLIRRGHRSSCSVFMPMLYIRNFFRLPDLIHATTDGAQISVLVDLTQHGRNRLGKNWKQPLTRFLEVVCNLYSSKCPPVLAVTDDVFVLESLRWDILKEYTNTTHRRPAPASVALHAKPDLFDPETITPGSLSEITAEVYGTDVMNIVDQGLKLRRAFLEAGDA